MLYFSSTFDILERDIIGKWKLLQYLILLNEKFFISSSKDFDISYETQSVESFYSNKKMCRFILIYNP